MLQIVLVLRVGEERPLQPTWVFAIFLAAGMAAAFAKVAEGRWKVCW